MVAPKTIWIVNQYAATPETGMSGRHRHLARELASRGHCVYVIAARWHHKLQNEQASLLAPFIEEREGFSFVRIDVPRYRHGHDWRRILNWHIFAWKLAMLHRRLPGKPDAVLASSPSLLTFIGARHVARKFGARLIFEVRDIWPLSLVEIGGVSPRHPLIRYLQAIEDKAYREADRVISNLPGAVEHMVERGMDRGKFTWIPNGFSRIDMDNPRPLPTSVTAEIPPDKFVVGYAGSFGPANALDTLIDAAAHLREEREIVFVLVGKGKDEMRLRAKVDSLKLDNVRFLEPVRKDQVTALLGTFSVCALAWKRSQLYRFGTSANKMAEYLYSGRPIINSYSGLYDPVEAASAGMTTEAENPAAMASAIASLYEMSESNRARIGDNARKTAIENYEFGKLAGMLEEVLFT